MIDLYTWPTPNGHKVQIMLEEVELPCRVVPVNITQGEQFRPAYRALNPNNKVPTMPIMTVAVRPARLRCSRAGLDALREDWVDVTKSDDAKRNLFGTPSNA